jgi:hypothetical protein
MTSRFEFATAQQILFGAGVATEIGALAATLGKRALVVTGGQTNESNRYSTRGAP